MPWNYRRNYFNPWLQHELVPDILFGPPPAVLQVSILRVTFLVIGSELYGEVGVYVCLSRLMNIPVVRLLMVCCTLQNCVADSYTRFCIIIIIVS